ncbi:hypothetical protein VdG1_04172 [Verticillium dahliae VDG1]|nr:hypothetical protein VdG1_04172 [Verticillium dahliae VDG1]
MSATQDFKTNFCFPVRVLANDKIKLVPFDQKERHAQRFHALAGSDAVLFTYTPSGPWHSLEEFQTEFVEKTSYARPDFFTYAVIDTTRPASAEDDEGELAGMMSYFQSSTTTRTTEIGWVYILPPYQRTHVATNAAGLLVRYALDRPEDGGLGLARVQWRAHARNAGSIKLAHRLGFKDEGITRWHMLFKDGVARGKTGNGRGLPPGGNPQDLWRDTATLSICWDDWVEGGRDLVQAAMDRKQ